MLICTNWYSDKMWLLSRNYDTKKCDAAEVECEICELFPIIRYFRVLWCTGRSGTWLDFYHLYFHVSKQYAARCEIIASRSLLSVIFESLLSLFFWENLDLYLDQPKKS